MTIKNKKELYTVLWKEARRLYIKYDLCKAGQGTCIAFQIKYKSEAYCCNGCKHLGKQGCKVQSLSCAVHCCYIGETHFNFVTNNLTITIQNRIAVLRKIAKKHGIPFGGRTCKTENFKHINYYKQY